MGDVGFDGPYGLQGPTGFKGEEGDTGPDGLPGKSWVQEIIMNKHVFKLICVMSIIVQNANTLINIWFYVYAPIVKQKHYTLVYYIIY